MAMRMHNPPHPGEVIRELCLEPLSVTVTQAAQHLGVSRKALSQLLNGHVGVSPEMAIRLSIASRWGSMGSQRHDAIDCFKSVRRGSESSPDAMVRPLKPSSISASSPLVTTTTGI